MKYNSYLNDLDVLIRQQFAKICMKTRVTQSSVIESCIKKFIEKNKDLLDPEDFESDKKQESLKPFFKK